MPQNFILFRQGKNAIGVFPSIEAAAQHIGEMKLLGYAVIPMSAPEPVSGEDPDSSVAISVASVAQGLSSPSLSQAASGMSASFSKAVVGWFPPLDPIDLLLALGNTHKWTHNPVYSGLLDVDILSFRGHDIFWRPANPTKDDIPLRRFLQVFAEAYPGIRGCIGNKIPIIKAMRSVFHLGLMETKNAVDEILFGYNPQR